MHTRKQPDYVPNGIYHIYNHANGHENLFVTDDNYRYFLKKYAEKLYGVVETISYALMPNHFHLLIKVRDKKALTDFIDQQIKRKKFINIPKELSNETRFHYIVHRQFHNFLSGYVKAFNKYTKRSGSLLRQNTCRKIVGDESYLLTAIAYIHLNAVYHGFTILPEEWPHSSCHAFLSNRHTKIPCAEILHWFGGKEAFFKFHQERLNRGLDEKFEK